MTMLIYRLFICGVFLFVFLWSLTLSSCTVNDPDDTDDDALILYLPLDVNTVWEYDARMSFSADAYGRSLYGIETWTVILYNSQKQEGTLRCEFEGTRYINDQWTGYRDTTDIHTSALYTFYIEDTKIFFRELMSAENVFERLNGISPNTGYRIYYPINAPDIIDNSYDPEIPSRTFTLEKGVGYHYLTAFSPGTISTHAIYNLRDFTIAGDNK